MTDFAKLVLAADTRQLKAAAGDLKHVAKQAGDTAVDVDSMAFKIGATLKRLAGPAAIGAAITSLAMLTKSAINTADELTKAAQSIGIGVEELSRLRYAADLSGVSFQGLQSSLNIMNRNLGNVSGTTNDAQKALASMGIEARNTDGTLKSSTAILKEMADVFRTMPDGAQKSALAMAVLGRSGADMIPLLNGGSSALAQLTEEADKFGIVIDAETGRKAEQFNDNLTRLSGMVGALGMRIAADLLPHLVNLTDWLTRNQDAVAGIGRAISGTIERVSNLASGVAYLVGRVSSAVSVFQNWAPWIDKASSRITSLTSAVGVALGPLGSMLRMLERVGVSSRGASDGLRDSTVGGGFSALQGIFDAPRKALGGLLATGGGSGGGGSSASGAVKAIGDAARDAARELEALQSKLAGVIGRLDPARAAREAREGMRATLNEAFGAGLLSEEERRKYFAAAMFDGPTGTLEDTLNLKVVIPMLETGKKVQSQTQFIADNFAQMSQRVTSSLQGLANSIRSGDILGILGGVLNTFVQLGSIGAFGSGLAGRINAAPSGVPSFAGGGFTGGGARAGGLDGKGGFMAMLHPNETVIDHTRGQGQPQRIEIVPSQYFDVVVDGRVMQAAPLIAQGGAAIAQAQSSNRARRSVRR